MKVVSAHYAKGKCADKDEGNCGEKCFEGWGTGGDLGFGKYSTKTNGDIFVN